MKKLIALTLALMIALLALLPAMAEGETASRPAVGGVLTLLNISEEDYNDIENDKYVLSSYLESQDVASNVDDYGIGTSAIIYYDSLDAMLMALQAGDVDWIEVPRATGDYLVARNDDLQMVGTQRGEKLTLDLEQILKRLASGFAFLMLEENAALRDEFDAAIDAMQADGTLDALVKTYITDAVANEEQEAITFDNRFEDTVTVAVTGNLPPLDYIAPDGSFAGFNTAVLSEIGKRIEKNIELVVTDSIGRTTALVSGVTDVVFWTRVSVGPMTGIPGEPEALHRRHLEEMEKRRKVNGEKSEVDEMLEKLGWSSGEEYGKIDMPDGTVVTDPYYVDFICPVMLKQN